MVEPAEPPARGKSRFKLPKWADTVFLLVGLGLLVYVVSRYPLAEVLDACLRLGPWVALTPLIALGWMCCNTSALHVLTGGQVPWWRLLKIRLIGDGYNALLPLAGFGGEPFKIKHLSMTVPVDQVLTALIRDRILENGVGFLFTGFWLGLTLALGRIALPDTLRVGMLVFVIVATAVGIGSLVAMVTSLPDRAGSAIARSLGAATQRAVILPGSRFAWVLFWYFAGRFIGLLESTVLLRLLGLGSDPLTIVFCYSFLGAAGYLSFGIPGGVGIFEGVTVYLFEILGHAGPIGVAFALARRGRMLILGLIGVLLHLATSLAARVRRARSSDG
jgi:hypothetical protein